MGYKGPVLRPRCTGAGRAWRQIPFIHSFKVKHDCYIGKGTQTTLSVIYRKYGDYKKLNVINSIQNLKILLSPNIFKTNKKRPATTWRLINWSVQNKIISWLMSEWRLALHQPTDTHYPGQVLHGVCILRCSSTAEQCNMNTPIRTQYMQPHHRHINHTPMYFNGLF